MKIKKIRNFKNFIENLLFLTIIATLFAIFASILYVVFEVLHAALFAVNLWGILLVVDVVLYFVIQGCDIWIWSIKNTRRKAAGKPMVEFKKKKYVSLALFWKCFYRSINVNYI